MVAGPRYNQAILLQSLRGQTGCPSPVSRRHQGRWLVRVLCRVRCWQTATNPHSLTPVCVFSFGELHLRPAPSRQAARTCVLVHNAWLGFLLFLPPPLVTVDGFPFNAMNAWEAISASWIALLYPLSAFWSASQRARRGRALGSGFPFLLPRAQWLAFFTSRVPSRRLVVHKVFGCFCPVLVLASLASCIFSTFSGWMPSWRFCRQ